MCRELVVNGALPAVGYCLRAHRTRLDCVHRALHRGAIAVPRFGAEPRCFGAGVALARPDSRMPTIANTEMATARSSVPRSGAPRRSATSYAAATRHRAIKTMASATAVHHNRRDAIASLTAVHPAMRCSENAPISTTTAINSSAWRARSVPRPELPRITLVHPGKRKGRAEPARPARRCKMRRKNANSTP